MAQRPLSRAQFSSNKLPASHPCPVLRTPPNLLPQLHTRQGAPLNSQPGPSGATPPLCPSSFCPPASGLSPPPDSVFSPAVLNSFRNVSQPQLWLDGSKQDRRAGKMDPVFIIKNVDFFPSRILWALTSILKKKILQERLPWWSRGLCAFTALEDRVQSLVRQQDPTNRGAWPKGKKMH